MKQRTITGAMIAAILVLVLLSREFTTYVFDIFMVAIGVIGAYEMTRLLAKMNCYNNKYVALAYPVVAYLVFLFGINMELKWFMIILIELAVLIILIGFVAIFGIVNSTGTKNEIKTRDLKIRNDNFSIYKALHTMFACLYPTVLIMLFVVLNNLYGMKYIFNTVNEHLPYISTFALILTFIVPIFTDIFAYFTGTIFKGKKLCPSISPNKTISGAIGGLIWGTVVAVAAFLIFNSMPEYNEVFVALNLQFWQFIIVGLVASFVSQVGDLFESKLKRKADVKDSGKLLPGHGGILDRIDSHLACVLVMFIFFMIVL